MSIVLKGLYKHFGNNMVVNNVSLEIEDGELFVLLGSSGSGKSTILRIVAGLLQPDSGSVEISGRDVTFLKTQKRNVGFVFQNYSLFRHLNVFENVEFGLQVRKIPRHERRERSKELLEVIGLTGLGDRYPHQLSGGQQQRVAVARALAYRPKVLLLDEPFGALDLKIRSVLRQSLLAIQKQLKVTTILVTHDQEEAFELADRIGVVDHGGMIETGSPDQLYHKPNTEIVATFIGGGNVLVGKEDRGRIRLGEVELPWPEHAPAHVQGSPVRVLFRPERVLIQRTPFLESERVHVLGQGRVVKQIFNGSIQRLILELHQLQGVRPLVPAMSYGQAQTRIEVVQTTSMQERRLGFEDNLWVGIRDFHVLEPSGIKFLACTTDASQPSPALKLALQMGQRARGIVTLFSVVSQEADIEGQLLNLIEIKRQWQDRVPQIFTHASTGDRATEILVKVQTQAYDILMLDQVMSDAENSIGSESVQRVILEQAALPVMIVSGQRASIKQILICTAAGEPGKTDVQVGSRLALRTGASVTVMSVIDPTTDAQEESRTYHYLEQAMQSLGALGVACQTLVLRGIPIEEILAEGGKAMYDMVVIGAPLPRAQHRIQWQDMTTRIIKQLNKSLLIVPMQE
ncbi:MAG: ATP-binding cassette domain-containing protein [Candidatus Marinimicrobia bacterium]|nr:ATP-binding cassette domain-containing protein [Candidatus Neomarinimicrobiota bacterium]